MYGADSTDGADGVDGADGMDGVDGADGADGAVGASWAVTLRAWRLSVVDKVGSLTTPWGMVQVSCLKMGEADARRRSPIRELSSSSSSSASPPLPSPSSSIDAEEA